VKLYLSSPNFHIFGRGTNWIIGRCKVALVESANLVFFECTNNAVKQTTVVEKDQVLLIPRKN